MKISKDNSTSDLIHKQLNKDIEKPLHKSTSTNVFSPKFKMKIGNEGQLIMNKLKRFQINFQTTDDSNQPLQGDKSKLDDPNLTERYKHYKHNSMGVLDNLEKPNIKFLTISHRDKLPPNSQRGSISNSTTTGPGTITNFKNSNTFSTISGGFTKKNSIVESKDKPEKAKNEAMDFLKKYSKDIKGLPKVEDEIRRISTINKHLSIKMNIEPQLGQKIKKKKKSIAANIRRNAYAFTSNLLQANKIESNFGGSKLNSGMKENVLRNNIHRRSVSNLLDTELETITRKMINENTKIFGKKTAVKSGLGLNNYIIRDFLIGGQSNGKSSM